jgi:predicted anti-sigma-YlaC factor YlaD
MTGMKAFWRLLNLPCEGMTRLASESLDRDLTRLERFALRSHLLYCAACRRYAQQVETLRRAVRRLVARVEAGEPLPGPGLPIDARERIKRALREPPL